MLRILFIILFLSRCVTSWTQTTVVSYTFDSSNEGWTVTSNTNGDWLRGVDIFSSGANDSYWYTSPSNYNNNAVLVVESPVIDLTGQVDLLFSFRIRHNTEAAWDGFQIEYSTNGGGAWTDLGAVGNGVNWYNDTDVDAIANGADGWSGDNAAWQTAQIALPATLENNANAMIRVRFESDGFITDEGVAFDDVVITSGYEIEVSGNSTEIVDGDTSPSFLDHTDFSSVDITSGTLIKTYTITNVGGGTLSLTGGTPVTISGTNAADFTVTSQPASSSLTGLQSTTFVVEFNPSAIGLRTATVSIANDDTDENPYTFDIQGTGVNAVVVHDFDANGFGWTVTANTNGNWSRGTGTLSTGADGNYWHTTPNGSYNSNAALTIESPVIDLTGQTDLSLYMDIRYDTEVDWDGMKVEYSDDGGANWFDLGTFGEGVGWYTDTDVDAFANDEDGWSGDNVGWTPAQIGLPLVLENNANAQFRVLFASDAFVTETGAAFDNFMIFTGIPDLLVSGNGREIVNGDTSPDALDNTDFRSVDIAAGIRSKVFTLTNAGGATLNFTGGTPVTISGTHAADFTITAQPAASIAGFASTTFTVEFNPSASGARYATIAIASDDPDENPFTFNITGTGDNAVIFQNFNTTNEGWTVTTATNGNWSWGTGILSTGADGSYWHTTPTTGYNSSATLTVQSGVLDLTGQTSITLFMDVSYDTEVDWDGYQVEYSTDGGTNWFDLGSTSEGINWYNDGDVDAIANNANGWSGDNVNWQTAELDLPTSLENNANARFRLTFASDNNVTATGVAFDNFTIFANVTPLPVELLTFEGYIQDNNAVLTWQTATELNNDYFEVLHSADGEYFESVGLVQGNGNSNNTLTYSYVHQAPLPGINYYQLKQVDFDGTTEFHQIIRLKNDINSLGEDIKVATYPNPASNSDDLRFRILSIDDRLEIRVKVINAAGQMIYNEVFEGAWVIDEKFSDIRMSQGIYFMTVEQGEVSRNHKLIIR